jgi:hypothetical protein
MRLQPIPHRPSARLALTAALAATLALGACGQGPADDDTTPAEAEAAASDAPVTPAADAETAEAPASGTPAYAAAYPGADFNPSGAATDLGGSVTFTTDDSPEAVIAFYQARARDSGLATVSALKQGQAQAYGAGDPDRQGTTLTVVAAPAEDDPDRTEVSVTWTVAR